MDEAQPNSPLTPESFERWVRAKCPPFEWFMDQPEDSQEVMAEIGDAYEKDLIVAQAMAIAGHRPVAAAPAESPEVALVQQLVQQTIAKLGGQASSRPSPLPAAPVQPTMSGITSRRQERKDQAQAIADSQRRILGRRPDSLEGKSP